MIDEKAVREIIERNFGKVAVIDDGGERVEWREGWVCNVGFNFKAIAEEIADMVERDYVRRDSYEHVVGLCETDVARFKAERDKLEKKLETLLCTLTNGKWSKSSYAVEDMVSMVRDEQEDELNEAVKEWSHSHPATVVDEHLEELKSLQEQREHWFGVAEKLYRRFYPRDEYCIPNDPSDMTLKAIDDLEAERDEWKAKAEGSSKVRAGSSNLEHLYRNCADFRATVCNNVVIYDHWYSGATGGMCFDDSEQADEWLMSEHAESGAER